MLIGFIDLTFDLDAVSLTLEMLFSPSGDGVGDNDHDHDDFLYFGVW